MASPLCSGSQGSPRPPELIQRRECQPVLPPCQHALVAGNTIAMPNTAGTSWATASTTARRPAFAAEAAGTAGLGAGAAGTATSVKSMPWGTRCGEGRPQASQAKQPAECRGCKGLEGMATGCGRCQRFGQLIKFGRFHLYSLLCVHMYLSRLKRRRGAD